MNDKQQLIAYIATLAALVLTAGAMAIAAAYHQTEAAAALGTIAVGIIGILKFPSSIKASAAVGSADSVNVNPPAQGN